MKNWRDEGLTDEYDPPRLSPEQWLQKHRETNAYGAALKAAHPVRYWLTIIGWFMFAVVISVGAVYLQWFYDFPLR